MIFPIAEEVERFLTEKENHDITKAEKRVMVTVLADFKAGMENGRYDHFTGRCHPVTVRISSLQIKDDKLELMIYHLHGASIKILSARDISLEHLEKELEEIGFNTLSSSGIKGNDRQLLEVYYFISSEETDPWGLFLFVLKY